MSEKKVVEKEPVTDAATEEKELNDEQLAKISGGTDSVVAAAVAPRDAASGLPTGKRMHKPMTIT